MPVRSQGASRRTAVSRTAPPWSLRAHAADVLIDREDWCHWCDPVAVARTFARAALVVGRI